MRVTGLEVVGGASRPSGGSCSSSGRAGCCASDDGGGAGGGVTTAAAGCGGATGCFAVRSAYLHSAVTSSSCVLRTLAFDSGVFVLVTSANASGRAGSISTSPDSAIAVDSVPVLPTMRPRTSGARKRLVSVPSLPAIDSEPSHAADTAGSTARPSFAKPLAPSTTATSSFGVICVRYDSPLPVSTTRSSRLTFACLPSQSYMVSTARSIVGAAWCVSAAADRITRSASQLTDHFWTSATIDASVRDSWRPSSTGTSPRPSESPTKSPSSSTRTSPVTVMPFATIAARSA